MGKRANYQFHTEYRGYRIFISEAGKTFYITGKHARVTQLFRSEKSAKEHVDYLIKTWEK